MARYRARAGPEASLSSVASLLTAMARKTFGIVGQWLALK
jgi:hypothetical protein